MMVCCIIPCTVTCVCGTCAMPCAHASTHAHTCMRGAARPARTRNTALIRAANKAKIVKLLLDTGAVDLNAAANSGYVDVGRRGAVRTCGHGDTSIWTGAQVRFNACCGAVACAFFFREVVRASGGCGLFFSITCSVRPVGRWRGM